MSRLFWGVRCQDHIELLLSIDGNLCVCSRCNNKIVIYDIVLIMTLYYRVWCPLWLSLNRDRRRRSLSMLASTMTKADLNTGAPSLAMSMAKFHLCVFPVRSTIMLSTAVRQWWQTSWISSLAAGLHSRSKNIYKLSRSKLSLNII